MKKITPLLFDSYLAVIKNSVGSKMFRNFYAKVNGQRTDIMKNGKLSCAFYVSAVLALFQLIKRQHATVDSTVKDLRESSWQPAKKPKIGSVLIWEKTDSGNGDFHQHIGFYIGGRKAISNSSKSGCPVRHHWTFGNKRKVKMILWNPKLKENPNRR